MPARAARFPGVYSYVRGMRNLQSPTGERFGSPGGNAGMNTGCSSVRPTTAGSPPRSNGKVRPQNQVRRGSQPGPGGEMEGFCTRKYSYGGLVGNELDIITRRVLSGRVLLIIEWLWPGILAGRGASPVITRMAQRNARMNGWMVHTTSASNTKRLAGRRRHCGMLHALVWCARVVVRAAGRWKARSRHGPGQGSGVPRLRSRAGAGSCSRSMATYEYSYEHTHITYYVSGVQANGNKHPGRPQGNVTTWKQT